MVSDAKRGEAKRQASAEEVRSEVTEEDGGGEVTSSAATSRIVLEIPEHAARSGIRKITFKLKKRKVLDVDEAKKGVRVKYVSPCKQVIFKEYMQLNYY